MCKLQLQLPSIIQITIVIVKNYHDGVRMHLSLEIFRNAQCTHYGRSKDGQLRSVHFKKIFEI